MDEQAQAGRGPSVFMSTLPRARRRRWPVVLLAGFIVDVGASLEPATFTVTNANAARAGSHSINVTATETIRDGAPSRYHRVIIALSSRYHRVIIAVSSQYHRSIIAVSSQYHRSNVLFVDI